MAAAESPPLDAGASEAADAEAADTRGWLVAMSDYEGLLGVFPDTESAERAINGHAGPVVAQAWPCDRIKGSAVWAIPSVGSCLPPLYVTNDRDDAIVTHHALTEIGAAPTADTVDTWKIEVGGFTPPGERRMAERLRKWTDADRVWAATRFRALMEGGLLSDAAGATRGAVTELVVRRDRRTEGADESKAEGEGESKAEGEGESKAEGEGESKAEGEGESKAEGEAEPPEPVGGVETPGQE